MPESLEVGHVELREALPSDREILFEHQRDPEAAAMAAFPSRDRDAYAAHWAKIHADPTTIFRTILADGEVAGNVGSWVEDGERDVGYSIGRSYWGRGIATRALEAFLALDKERPLFAHVARHNIASRRVLAKCGFVEVGGDAEELVVRLDS
jgi:RimJ/RimL family protein N-acetyltransferase